MIFQIAKVCKTLTMKVLNKQTVSIQSEGAAREWSTVVKISIPPPSFKPVPLSLSRISSIVKHPNKSFFNVFNIWTLLPTVYYYIS